MEHEIDLKIVVVGDGNVGKTSMLTSYCHDRFSMNYQPTGMYLIKSTQIVQHLFQNKRCFKISDVSK